MMPCYVIDGVLVLITGMFINIIWFRHVNDSEKYENFTIKLKFMSMYSYEKSNCGQYTLFKLSNLGSLIY